MRVIVFNFCSSIHCCVKTYHAMDNKGILALEFQELSHEYGLSGESEAAVGAQTHDLGSLEYSEDPLDLESSSAKLEDGETELVRRFLLTSCGCKMGKEHKACSSALTFREIIDYRANCHELTSNELDMVIPGQLRAHDTTTHSLSEIGGCQKKRSHCATATYNFRNSQLCRKSFLFLHTVSDKRFRNLVEHYKVFGVTPRSHGLAGRSPSNTTSFGRLLQFVKNLASSISLPLPGHLPNLRDERVQLLPTDMSKMEVYQKYCKAAENEYTTC